ncbi:EAL domain-containing protein, partial [Treponema sp. OttesenSCG-928-L16]|nr:EAL domain-containing protein [Treponema sp. OttesenSCG-928-L16]
KYREAQGKLIQQVFTLIEPQNLSPLIPKALPLDDVPVLFRDVIVKGHQGSTFIIDGSISKIESTSNEPPGYVLVMRDISKMKKMSATIDYQASHDALTGLSNREGFTLKLKDVLDTVKRAGGEHSLLELDLDRFTVVNDTGGTAAGDELLRQIAKIILSHTERHDISGRLGGDEFAVILRDCAVENAVSVAERLLNAVRQFNFTYNNKIFPVSFSIGLVPIGEQNIDTHAILAAADDACSIAKEEGGNRIKIYRSGEERYLIRRGQMQWVSKINEALLNDRFRLWYQSIDPLQDENIKGKIEILLRMENDDGTISQPGDFIPSAERYGLITAIDRWVVENAVKTWLQLKKNKNVLVNRIFSLNLSGQSVLDENFISFIIELFESTKAPPKNFCFEITETVAMQNLANASHFINVLREKGFTFSLDDFGSGFSSFTYLKNLPVDYLKIDGSIVKDIDENRVNYIMVQSINSMCHVIGLKTIGEYAQNEKVIETLRSIGADYAQGYALSEPLPLR